MITRRQLGLLTAALLASFVPATTAQATFPGENGRIVFASDRQSGVYQLYSMQDGGSGVRRLTFLPHVLTVFPSWSPDGAAIAFEGDSPKGTRDSELFTVAMGSGRIHQLTRNRGLDADPAWSPDGRWLTFCHAATQTGAPDVYVMRRDGSHIRRLTSNLASDCEPQWSPDGRWIAFASDRAGGSRSAIYLTKPSGGGAHRVTPLRLDSGDPNWRPDGRQLAFESHVSSPHSSIYTIGLDGSGLRRLTAGPHSENDLFPSFSPDGRRITFFSDRTGATHIWVMYANGTAARDLTRRSTAINFAPDWGPTG
jgi:TolB protein